MIKSKKLIQRFLVIWITIFGFILAQENHTLTFAPLPMENKSKTLEYFLPLIQYLQTALHTKIKIQYQSDYKEIINGFKSQTIDIAYLGPLPIAILKSQYNHIEPIITVREKNGNTHYRCVLSKFVDDVLPQDRVWRVALTQPLSTCGYYMTQKLIESKFQKQLSQQHYAYMMSHTKALIETLKGNYDIASSAEMVGEKFVSLGMEIIARSEPLPGFALVVNTKTVSKKKIRQLTQTILQIPPKIYQNWNDKFRYGFSVADCTSYDAITVTYEIPQKDNIK